MSRFKCLIAAGAILLPVCASFAEAPAGPPSMQIQGGLLTGEGAELIQSQLPEAQFILVGEDHGFADPPEIALALAREAAKHGVSRHVIETGPITARQIEALLRDGGPDDIRTLISHQPLAVPFLNMSEDALLADFFADAAPAGEPALWGVDQEFIGSALLHLQTLNSLAQTPEQAAIASDLLQKERAAFATGDMSQVLLVSWSPEEFRALDAEFAGIPGATSIISALQVSAGIYQSYMSGANYASNADRIRLMRNQFLDAYRADSGTPPRALFKFGATHLGRGTTPMNMFDLGSLTEGVAAANNLSVLRIAIIPLSGRQTITNPSADELFQEVDYRSETVEALLMAAGIAESDLASGAYSVIALDTLRRQLEQQTIDTLPEEAKFILLGYDFLVTTPDARPATPLSE